MIPTSNSPNLTAVQEATKYHWPSHERPCDKPPEGLNSHETPYNPQESGFTMGTHVKPSFLGVISPIYWWCKTFMDFMGLGSHGTVIRSPAKNNDSNGVQRISGWNKMSETHV